MEGKSQNWALSRGPVLETESGNLRLSGFEPSVRPGLSVLFSSKFAALRGFLTLKKINAPAPRGPASPLF
jgi:hypothetical protein